MSDKTIIEYTVVYIEQDGIDGFKGRIDDLIQEGWQPWGNLAVINSRHDGTNLFQAMVKYSEDI